MEIETLPPLPPIENVLLPPTSQMEIENCLPPSTKKTYDLMRMVAQRSTCALRGCVVRLAKFFTQEEEANPESWWNKCCAIIIEVQVLLSLNHKASKTAKTPIFNASMVIVLLHDGVIKTHTQVLKSFMNMCGNKHRYHPVGTLLQVEMGKDSSGRTLFKPFNDFLPFIIRGSLKKGRMSEQTYDALVEWLETNSRLDNLVSKDAPRHRGELPLNVEVSSLLKTGPKSSFKSPSSKRRKVLDSEDSCAPSSVQTWHSEIRLANSSVQTVDVKPDCAFYYAVCSIMDLPLATDKCKIQILRILVKQSSLMRP